MANFQQKQQSSKRGGKQHVVQYNSATAWSTTFSAGIYQVRASAQLAGWCSINDTTADSIMASSAGGVGMVLPANFPEYFSVNPGQIFVYTSTSTSTGACSVTEMS